MTEDVRLSPSGRKLDTSEELAALEASMVVANAEIAEIWDILEGGGGGAVLSVFGRSGAVVGQAGDYDASQVANDSGVSGATTADALDALAGTIAGLLTGVSSVFGRAGAVVAAAGDYNTTQVTNSSGVLGATATAALNTLSSTIGALVTGVSSVFGRGGAVTAQAGDYTDAQVTNTSTVSGSTVAAALNALATSGFFTWGAVSSPGVTAVRFFLRTAATPGSTEAQGQIVVGRACTITTLRASFGTASPTATFTFTLRVNGASSALTLVVPATQTSGATTGAAIALAAGDRISIQLDANLVDTVSAWNCSVIVH